MTSPLIGWPRRRPVRPRLTPITFAHRGAPRVRHEENTLAAFDHALTQGARGLESDIALTADGVPVLVHLAPFHHGPGIGALRRAELPPSIPTLADLYEHCGTAFELSLDMGQPRAVEAVIDVATRAGALDRLWLTYWRTDTLARWRERWPDVHLVYPTIPLSPGRARSVAGDLAEIGVDALNLYHPFCTAGAVQRAHEYGLLVFAWGLKRPGGLKRVLRQQVDGVFGDDVEVMVRAAH